MNDPWYLPRDEDSMKPRMLSPREASIKQRAASVQSSGDHRKQQALQIVTLKDIRVFDELLLDYDKK